MFNISFCCCRHNVSNIFVQLTEGRSARDQPKQPPAKKNSEFGVRGEFIETHEVSERYLHIRSNTSKSTKENDEPKGGKEGKDTLDGKGKDHQLFQPSRQTTLKPKSRRSGQGLQLRPRRPHGRGRAAMAAFPDPSGPVVALPLCKATGDDRGAMAAFPDQVGRLAEKKNVVWSPRARSGRGSAPQWPLSLRKDSMSKNHKPWQGRRRRKLFFELMPCAINVMPLCGLVVRANSPSF